MKSHVNNKSTKVTLSIDLETWQNMKMLSDILSISISRITSLFYQELLTGKINDTDFEKYFKAGQYEKYRV